jgi:hypothetical protein
MSSFLAALVARGTRRLADAAGPAEQAAGIEGLEAAEYVAVAPGGTARPEPPTPILPSPVSEDHKPSDGGPPVDASRTHADDPSEPARLVAPATTASAAVPARPVAEPTKGASPAPPALPTPAAQKRRPEKVTPAGQVSPRGTALRSDVDGRYPAAAPLRNAGIRSVTLMPAVTAAIPAGPGPTAIVPAPTATDEHSAPDDRTADWRDLSRRLLSAHPPAAETAGAEPASPRSPEATTGDRAKGDEPELVVEHLEIHVVDPRQTGVAAPPARRSRPATRPGAWDAAARHYVGGW